MQHRAEVFGGAWHRPDLNWRDLAALVLIVAVILAVGSGARQMLAPFAAAQAPEISLAPAALPNYALRTILRMLLALCVSLAFTFTYGTLAAKSRRADTVAKAIDLFAKHDISALPVVDDNDAVVGIISEADLVHREEIDTQIHRPWWLEAVTPASTLAKEFAKSHGRRVDEVMSTHVVSASEDTPLAEIATLLERHRIKRVPILRDGKLVGIVSRANIIQALASPQSATKANAGTSAGNDRAIRLDLLDRLGRQPWTGFGERNVTVHSGVVHLWGLVGSEAERKALAALAEEVPGVVHVSDEMIPSY